MTTDKQIELIDELADKCCRDFDIHKSCMACWRRTQSCGKFITLAKLVQEGCRIVPKGFWGVARVYNEYTMSYNVKTVCSLCSYDIGYEGTVVKPNYCPKCGACMKED